MIDRLMAKSRPQCWPKDRQIPASIYLPNHLCDVWDTAGQVLNHSGDAQLRALRLLNDTTRERFVRVVRLAAALHDLGKANDHFQMMVRGKRREPQAVRHEWATLIAIEFAFDGALRNWLRPAVRSDLDWAFVTWAIAGHHPKFHRPMPPDPIDGSGTDFRLLGGHADFRRCLEWLQRVFDLDRNIPPTADCRIELVGRRSVFRQLQRWFADQEGLAESMVSADHQLLAACKACLIGADVSGSAIPMDVADSEEQRSWIGHALRQLPTADELEQIVCDRLNGDQLRQFQIDVGESRAPITLVKAGCGSGKTLGAYNWAKNQHPNKRLWFCYPTTGTATEGFRDYLVNDGETRFGARLFHSRKNVDLELFDVKETAPTSSTDGDDEDDSFDTFTRICSLDAWATPIVSCTADTVLGLLPNHRRGLYAWPALADSAFIFDEVHAYDDRLFGFLLTFLERLPGLPVLLMTASLPQSRLDAIREVSSRIHGYALMEIDGPIELENLARYRREGLVVEEWPLSEIADAVHAGENVLWVCNTVGRAMSAREAASQAGLCPLLYHSRFKYRDRVRRHGDVIDAFRQSHSTGVLAICTQVAEMSLDLSADLLVTDLAPVPALIQRLGRLNRRARPPVAGESAPPTKPFFVVRPVDANGNAAALPYSLERLEGAEKWLDRLGCGELSQADLVRAWEAILEPADRDGRTRSSWLEGGPRTTVESLRDATPGISVVLENDAIDLRTGHVRPVEVAIPMPVPPKRHQWRNWPIIRGLRVAPTSAIHYDPMVGAYWL